MAGTFSSFNNKGPGGAAGSFDASLLFPKRSSTKYGKALDWDKVLKGIKKDDKAYADQAQRALAATINYRPTNPTERGKALVAAGGDAALADINRARQSGRIGKGSSLSDIQNLILKGRQYYDLDAETRSLYRQMLRAEADIKRMGEKPHKDGPSVLGRVMDVLSRGNYAAANAIKQSNKGIGKALKDGFQFSDIDDIAKSTLGVAALPAAWQGLSGKKKVTFQEVLGAPVGEKGGGYGWNPDSKAGKIGKGALGLGLDIFLDPTTYIGIGAAKTVVKGGKDATKLVKAGDVRKSLKTSPATLQKIHKELDKLLDLDLESVGYKPLDDAGKVIEGKGTGLLPKEAPRELRLKQVESFFTAVRNADGSPVARDQVASQLRKAEHYLAYASRAAVEQNASKASQALKMVSTYEFVKKTAEQVYKHFEDTAAGDILQRWAQQGRVLVDVPEATVKKTKLNKARYANFKKQMDKKIAAQRGLLTKAKKKGASDAELKKIKDKIYDLETEKTYPEIYGRPIGDEAPDPRIWDTVYEGTARKEALAHNKSIMDDLERELVLARPAGIDETHTALLEIAAREVNPEVSRLIQIRYGGLFGGGGAVMATFRAPDVFRKAAEKFAREGHDKQALNLWNKSVMRFSETFRASGSLDKFIDAERLRTAGRANELIHLHVQDLRNRLGKIKKSDRIAIFDAWKKGVPAEGMGDDLVDLLIDFDAELTDMAKFWDGTMNEVLGDLTPADLNKWLPKKRVSLVPVKDPSLRVGTSEWWQLALRETVSRDLAEVMHQLRIAKEKMVARAMLTKNIEDTLGISAINASGDSTFYHQLRTKNDYVNVKGFRQDVVFAPDIARDLHRLIELVDDQAKHQDILKGFDKTLNLWKSAVTVYNPAFHIRNSAGDLFVSYLNGMFVGRGGIKRAMKSQRAAIKTMRAMKWQKMDPSLRIKMMGENPAFTGELHEVGVGSHVLTVPRAFAEIGDKITAEQLWGAYLKYGLKQAFTSTEFGKIVSGTRGVRGAASYANETVRGLSEGREDWFRLAHFADVLQRESLTERSFERAAAKAAQDVRKFHFDYSDFTPFERSTLIRAIPFYKWTRKSLPLMVEMMFAKPGAITVYPKGLSNLSQMMGYPVGDDPLVPDSDAIIPDWIRNRGAVPLYTSSRGNTVFFDPSNPFNDTVRTWQGEKASDLLTGKGPVNALLSMLNPLARVPIELATGRSFFGDYPIRGKEGRYLAGQSPQTSFILKQIYGDSAELPAQDRLSSPETLNKILAGGTIENTPRAISGELRRLNDILNSQRKAVRNKKGYPDPR